MSAPPQKSESWVRDVESIFKPPKHRFSKSAEEEPVRRNSPPRFLGKRRKSGNDLKIPFKSPSPQSSSSSKSDECNTKENAFKQGSDEENEEQFPIKFSLSQDYKSDASFTDYLKENLMGPSPRGSPALGPSNSFGGYFAPSPLHVQGSETFDFESNGGGFPMPKLQMSPMSGMSTPPRGNSKSGDGGDSLANAKLESPPTIKRPPAKDGNGKLPTPGIPMEPSHGNRRGPMSSSPRYPAAEDGSPVRPVRPGHRHHHASGPTQHMSPGQTLYNVASKSVGTPPSPYQQYGQPPPPPSPYDRPPPPPSSPYQPYPWRPHSHPGHSTPQSRVSHHEGGANEASPEFNPPRGNLRGQSRSGYRETTITVTAPEAMAGGDDGPAESKSGEIDPITPSPNIRQAVSDESTSPSLAPTVHHPPARPPPPLSSSSAGGWSDSLHMAPLPPYVQAPHQLGGWGGEHPPALPLPPGAGYPPPHSSHHASHHPSYYHSPYYHQHQHPQPPQRPPIPDHAASNDTGDTGPKRASSSEQANWRKHHHLLHQFLLQFGHCVVPQGYGLGTHYEGLHRWCNEQRTQYQLMCRGNSSDDHSVAKASTMTPTRVRILTSMGFVWGHPPCDFRPPPATAATSVGSPGNPPAAKPYSTWDKWMELLFDYRSQHGDVDVPLKYKPNPSLGTFVNRQRTEYRKMQSGKPSSMTPERVDDLNRLGFTWAVREAHTSWEERFEELKAFRNENGHCNVPKVYPSLGYWVNEQRFQYRRLLKKKPSYMTQDKIKALNGLDFKWSLRETNGSWENWLKELREYKSQHGDVDVPLKYRHNQALGAFVNRQRTEYRKLQQGLQTSLTQDRIQNLNDLGFKWAIRVSRTPWETRLDELKKFKEQHGHCNVPSTYPKNQPLAYWVFKQRGQYRIYKKRDYVMPGEKKQMCHMTPERISKLDAIGFEWNPPRRIK